MFALFLAKKSEKKKRENGRKEQVNFTVFLILTRDIMFVIYDPCL